jgi:ketosteroid isomerase-like protein
MAAIESEVHETLDRFLRAVESCDVERIASFFEDDAQMFSPISIYPRRLDGKPAIVEQFKTIIKFLREAPQPVTLEPVDLVVRDLGGTAALVTFHLSQPAPVHRRTFVLRRAAAGWRIAHIHASVESPPA